MMVKVKNMVEMNNQKIFPVLWFDYQAEEAMNFYTPIFKKLKVLLALEKVGPDLKVAY
jgi:predicted 3-demethylubiquinone-9 3-methyltransferase (glyoxalase superfamily)